MSDIISAKFAHVKRQQELQQRQPHRCDQPRCASLNPFPTRDKFWSHFVDEHPDQIARNEPLAAFCTRKCEQCRVPREGRPDASQGSTKVMQPAPHANEPSRTEKRASPDAVPGADKMQDIQENTSALRIGKSIPKQIGHGKTLPKRGASDLGRENGGMAPPGNRSTFAKRPKGAPQRKPGPGPRLQRQVDPDFDRSLPIKGIPAVSDRPEETAHRTPKRLFNPDRDDATKFNPQLSSPVGTGPRLNDEGQPSGWRREPRRDSKARPVAVKGEQLQAAMPRNEPAAPGPVDADVRPAAEASQETDFVESEERLKMILKPVTHKISQEQLIQEVKGIYEGLVMVEKKCSEVDTKQHQAALEMDGSQPKLTGEQWLALIALHRTLLHEHHDFFLASQHPSASNSLKRLAKKHSMPARMWRHGIHSFLELLRHRLPDSMEHMLTFVHLAYSMVALLYETVPAFEDTWIECLGDLARYRMAIEDEDPSDREVWQNVARSWYSKAADKTPYVGRLYHHLAILARPDMLQQLFYYCKSLGVSLPFGSARESILTVFDPIFNPDVLGNKNRPVDAAFVQLHSITFTHIEFEKFDVSLDEFLDVLDKHISRPNYDWKTQGLFMAVCNITALYQYGAKDSLLHRAWREGRKNHALVDEVLPDAPASPLPESLENTENLLPDGRGPREEDDKEQKQREIEVDTESEAVAGSIQDISLNISKRLGFSVLSLTLERINDPNVMPHWHAWMVFLHHIINSKPAIQLIEIDFPWTALVEMLNELRATYKDNKIDVEAFPVSDKQPLPEDYTLRGLDWTRLYFPGDWFADAQVYSEKREEERQNTRDIRVERILWLARRICSVRSPAIVEKIFSSFGDVPIQVDAFIEYDAELNTFSMHPALRARIEGSHNRAATAAKQREMALTALNADDSDVEMTAVGCSNSDDEDYVMVIPEHVRKLKEKKRQLEAQIQAATGPAVATPEAIAEVTGSAIIKGADCLKLQYTAFVVDTNLLVSHLETFNLITNKGWPVIIPNSVITELHGLGNNPGQVSDSAKSAMIAINKALADRRDVRIITAKGNDVTKVGFYREKLERDEDDETRNIDDIIIKATKNQADARRQMFGEAGMGNAQPAILLTEDTNMRVKANARGVPAISTTNLKRYLVQLGTRMSPKLKHKPTPTAFVARSDADDPLHGPIDGIELLQKSPNRRRPFRRGITQPHT